MKELYSHKILASFYLWFDHNLLEHCEAYTNVSGRLYPQYDERKEATKVSYASPFRQWVYDTSITGAAVPSGVIINGVYKTRTDGVTFDYDNGRILASSGTYGADAAVTGHYAYKELNTYVVAMQDQQMVFDGNFQPRSRYNMMAQTGVNPYGFAAPACFIMNTLSDNQPFALGGMQDTKNKFRVIVVTDDSFLLDGVTSVFRDLNESTVPIVSLTDSPLNESGDYKGTPYNYDTLAAANSSRYMFIEKVSIAKTTTNSQSKFNSNLRYAIMDFYLSDPRFPKLEL